MSSPADFRRRHEAEWLELEDLTTRALVRGIQRDPAELPRLVRLHRRLMSTLPLAWRVVVDPGVLHYLESLAARSHLALHGAVPPRARLPSWLRQVVQAIRGMRLELSIAVLLLLAGGFIGLGLTHADPAWFFALTDGTWTEGSPADRTETLRLGLETPRSGRPDAVVLGAMGLAAFTFAWLGGIPTAIVLVWVGLRFGALFSLYTSRDLGGTFAMWLLPHGMAEVVGVLLCGVAGLSIGRAALFPGSEAPSLRMQRTARRAGPLVLAGVACFAVAAVFEATLAGRGFGAAMIAANLQSGVIALLVLGGRAPTTSSLSASSIVPALLREGNDRFVRIAAPEGHQLRFALATLGERGLALTIDVIGLALLYFATARTLEIRMDDWLLLVLFGWGLSHAYFVFFEYRWQGATPGKRLLGLRVMSRDGRALHFGSLLTRNLLRDVEVFAVLALAILLTFGGDSLVRSCIAIFWIAAVVLLPTLDAQRRRVGDLVANTVVIRTPKADLVVDEAESCDAATLHFTPSQLSIYEPHHVAELAQLLRRSSMMGERGSSALRDVAGVIAAKVGLPPDAIEPDPERFLRLFYGAQRRYFELLDLPGATR